MTGASGPKFPAAWPGRTFVCVDRSNRLVRCASKPVRNRTGRIQLKKRSTTLRISWRVQRPIPVDPYAATPHVPQSPRKSIDLFAPFSGTHPSTQPARPIDGGTPQHPRRRHDQSHSPGGRQMKIASDNNSAPVAPSSIYLLLNGFCNDYSQFLCDLYELVVNLNTQVFAEPRH